MNTEKKAAKKVNVAKVIDALKVQTSVRAGLLSVGNPGDPGVGCRTCGINSGWPGGGVVKV
jgi:hypothetical protein